MQGCTKKDRDSAMYPEQTSRDSNGLVPLKYILVEKGYDDNLPGLPILTTTRLQLELLLNDPVVDLRAVTEVILADAGATLQILRTVGREFSLHDGRPNRIEDCIVSLSAARCYQVVCAAQEAEPAKYVEEWQLCRRTAECARQLARTREGFSLEEAYLVGLLFRLGAIPQLLGWSLDGSTRGEHHALGVMLALHWNLPDCVILAVKEHHEEAPGNKWREFLRLADELARRPRA